MSKGMRWNAPRGAYARGWQTSPDEVKRETVHQQIHEDLPSWPGREQAERALARRGMVRLDSRGGSMAKR